MAYALEITTPTPMYNPLIPSYTIGTILSGIIGLFILIAFILSFIFVILGALNWITSGGDKAKVETARTRIINALVGLILVASIWAIINFLFPVVGLSFPTITFPSLGRGLENLTK